MGLLDELSWRGLVQDTIPGTAEQLDKEMTSGYIGFDPTADSLHIGSLVPILLLVHFQRAGHRPVVLVGGATGMVGDPTGKSEERNLLDAETLNHNLSGIRAQLEKYLDFSPGKKNAAIMVNNADWFSGIGFLDFIRDVGKHITVNYMMGKDSVRKRLESPIGMSFTEFTYQLIQGYDFYWLYQNRSVKLQMGGSDQWGNITTGTELIRRKTGGEAFAFTCPLLKKSDGGKFGKTEKGNVWLDPVRTTPYQFYQFWLNASDEDAEKWIRLFTFLGQEEVEQLVNTHRNNPGHRQLQKKLAQEVTVFIHGAAAYQEAMLTTEKLFANQSAPAETLSISDLESLEGIVHLSFPAARLAATPDLVSFLAEAAVFSSKGESRKMIQQGGVSINRRKHTDPATPVDRSFLLHDKYILVQKGRKNYYLVSIQSV